MKNTLPKSDRLTNRVSISQIYNGGKHLNEFPFKIVWRKEEEADYLGLKVVFSVPKRKFKRAVDRNQIKRLIREVYRSNKQLCFESAETKNMSVSLFIVYLGKEIPSYQLVEDKIILLLNRLTNDINTK